MANKSHCGKREICSSFCREPFRTCFGKRSDAFYCYNDDKAKMWPSNWHPMNPNLLCVGGGCSCQENAKYDAPTTARSSSSQQQFSVTQSSHQSQFGRNQFYVQAPLPPPPRKKLSRELLDIRDYLRNCMYQRLNINWTDEDDAILIKCIYNNLIKVRPPGRVCPMLDEIMQKSKNVLFTEFVLKIREEFSKNGHCDPLPMPCFATCSQQHQPTYQYGQQQQPAPQVQHVTEAPKVIRTKCYVCGKLECACDRNKTNMRTKNSRMESARAADLRSPSNRRQYEAGTSAAFSQPKIRTNRSSDDDSDVEPVKTNSHRKKCQCRAK